MLLHKHRFYGTLVGGQKSWTTDKFSGRELIQLSVVPTSSTNNYDLTIVDGDGDPVALYTNVTGTLLRQERCPLQGTYTVLVSGASIDEPVLVVVRVGES